MRILSMYLPQFHRVKENDEWWGEGFTEWTAVKMAEKVFENHYQPHVPLAHKYYDLSKRETLQWQADLMAQYGVDGQCFYHYWFKDGRQILETPAENLLLWKEINMPFCFCWANETWARSWSQINNVNTWAITYEKGQDRTDTGVLLEQKYGGEEQWKKHFDYLLPFFKDSRYIRRDGKPVFVIYKSSQIFCLREMLEKWNELAKAQGLEGIYVIGANTNNNSKVERCLNDILYHEPQHVLSMCKDINSRRPFRLEYDIAWSQLLSYQSVGDNAIYGGFVGYDDTPRRGKNGAIIENADPEKFKTYLAELLAKNVANGNDLIFINAWNEWGEGMHLEPDEKHKYGFLRGISYARDHYHEYLAKYERSIDNQSMKNEVEIWSKKSARYEGYWRILDAWLCMMERGVSLEDYFVGNGIGSIAIYGMGMLGKHLLNELKNGKIEVKCAVDRKADGIHTDLKMYSPEDDFPETDAVVVTATYAFQEIKEQLEARGYNNVISLEEILFE